MDRKTKVVVLLFLALAVLLGYGCGDAGSVAGPDDPTGTPTSATTPTWEAAARPNVLMIVADDMGWGDLGSQGSVIKTPALDSLAADGVRLTAFYTNTPLCSPARASLYTGRWAPRTGIPWNPPLGLHADEVVVAQVLRTAGYATAIVGKWHLGWGASNMPVHYGFDHYVGIPNGSDTKEWTEGDALKYRRIGPGEITQTYTDEALKWLATVPSGTPWFLVVAHRDPHTPLVPALGFKGRSAGGLYGDVVEGMDHHVGRLLAGLRAMGQEEQTLVVFLSDNGPAREQPEWPTTGSTGPFRGQKGFCLEGGVRVPAIVRWPRVVPAGRVNDTVMSTVDLFPTLVSLARAQMPERRKYDGTNVAGILTGEQTALPLPRGVAFFQTAGHPGGFRSGQYKLLLDGTWGRGGLYDLLADQGERNDLTSQLPDVADRLEREMEEAIR